MKSNRTIKEFILVLVLASIMGYFMCPECFNSLEYFWKLEAIMISIWLIMWYGNTYVSHSIDRYVSWLENPGKRFALGIIGAAVYSASAIMTMSLIFRRIFNVDIGDNWQIVWITIVVSIVVLLFMLSKEFLYSWRELSLREEKMRNEVLVSRFEVLKNQINPHFMFNGLNALSSLVHEDQDLAVKYIEQLSKVLRYVLEAGKQEVVTLAEELEILNAYIFLQKIRYNESLFVDINLPDSEKGYYIAPLVLQMLIENAIKHNEITKDNPLRIELSLEGNYLIVRNNVSIKEVALQESTNMGLPNIQSRYEALTDQKVLIEKSAKEFKVSIPLINKA